MMVDKAQNKKNSDLWGNDLNKYEPSRQVNLNIRGSSRHRFGRTLEYMLQTISINWLPMRLIWLPWRVVFIERCDCMYIWFLSEESFHEAVWLAMGVSRLAGRWLVWPIFGQDGTCHVRRLLAQRCQTRTQPYHRLHRGKSTELVTFSGTENMIHSAAEE